MTRNTVVRRDSKGNAIPRTQKGLVLSPFNKRTKELRNQNETFDFYTWFIGMKVKNKSSWVYKNFEAHEDKVKCKFCECIYNYENFQPGTAGRHLKTHIRVEKNKKKFISNEKTNLLWKSLTCVFHKLPYSIVEGEYFRNLLQDCKDQESEVVPVHSHETISKKVIELAKSMKSKIKEEIMGIDYLSLCIDCWTSKSSMHFLGVTAHWIDSNSDIVSRMILCKHIIKTDNFANQSDILAEELKKMFDFYSIKDKIVCITTDQGSDITCAIKKLDLLDKWYKCFLHRLNLCYNHSFNTKDISGESVRVSSYVDVCSNYIVLKKLHKLITKSRISISISEEFKSKNINKIPSFSYTRWGGFIRSMTIYLNQLEKINSILKEHIDKRFLLTDDENQEINMLVEIFLPHIEYMIDIERESESTFPMSILAHHNIKKSFRIIPRINPKFVNTKKIVSSFKSNFYQYFDNELSDTERIIYFLDPLAKSNIFNYKEEEMKELIKEEIRKIDSMEELRRNNGFITSRLFSEISFMDESFVDDSSIEINDSQEFYSNTENDTDFNEDFSTRDDVISEIDNTIQSQNTIFFKIRQVPTLKNRPANSIYNIEKETITVDTLDIEINSYIENKKHNKLTAINFWKINSTTYPNLYKLVKKYLHCQPSSISIERCWSHATDIDSNKRGRLSEKSLQSQILLSSNSKLAKKCYFEE